MTKDELKLAFQKAFQMGQDYWYHANHEFESYNKKSDAIKEKFNEMVKETIEEALAQPEQCTYPDCDYPCMNLPDCKQPKSIKQWVGLTDEEKAELWEVSRAALPRYATYGSLVEAKLRSKNT